MTKDFYSSPERINRVYINEYSEEKSKKALIQPDSTIYKVKIIDIERYLTQKYADQLVE